MMKSKICREQGAMSQQNFVFFFLKKNSKKHTVHCVQCMYIFLKMFKMHFLTVEPDRNASCVLPTDKFSLALAVLPRFAWPSNTRMGFFLLIRK